MRNLIRVTAAAVFMFMGANAHANDRAVVEAFYSQLLSNPTAPDITTRARKIVVEDWVSIPTPRGGKGAEGLIKTLKKFGKAISKIKWQPQEILQVGNRYIVRSIASGTPNGKFFGKPAKGSFEIMTIDIHEVKDGKIVQSYHVEDWARAIRQVSASKKH
ncbi:MAG: ester cyclase [Hyphomicrobiaceae bacterium]